MNLNLVRRQSKGSRLTAVDHDTNLDKIEQAISDIEQQPAPPGPAGPAGDDGRNIELRNSSTHIQWRYAGDATWLNLVALSTITGPQGGAGQQGAAGRNIELQTGATHIQWRYAGDATWLNLVPLSAITGPPAPALSVLRFTLGVTGRSLQPGQFSEVLIPAAGVQLSDFVDRASYSKPLPAAVKTEFQCQDGQVLAVFRNVGTVNSYVPSGVVCVEVAENTGPMPEAPPEPEDPGNPVDPDPEDPDPEDPDPEDPDPEDPDPDPPGEPDISIVQPFLTSQSTTDAGWVGSGNAANGHSFSWQNSSAVSGTAGAIGGTFARATGFAYFADTSITALVRTNTIRMAGSFRLVNSDFDGAFYLGYFPHASLTAGSPPAQFIGIEFSEPSGDASNPFRGAARINGTGGVASAVVSLAQNVNHSFDLTWTGKPDGSGTLAGTLAGQAINIAAGVGTATFTAFGLLVGGSSTAASGQNTGTCLFDDLQYRKGTVLPPVPDPPPPTGTPLAQVLVPTKIFNARNLPADVNGGVSAVGNNVADDTAAVEACIAAARNWAATTGEWTMAYFPRGRYRVQRRIVVTGGGYAIGGAGAYLSSIVGHDVGDSQISPVLDIIDFTGRIEFIDVRHNSDQLRLVVRQSSSDNSKPSRIHYEHCVFNGWGNEFVNVSDTSLGFTTNRGMVWQMQNLNANSTFTSYGTNSQLKGVSFDNCSNARVLLSQYGKQGWGALRIRGATALRNGFFGGLNVYGPVRVEDNQSLVFSDAYMEQLRPPTTRDLKRMASPQFVLSGVAGDTREGRVTACLGVLDSAYGNSSQLNTDTQKLPYEIYFTLKNYRGRFSILGTKHKNAPTPGSSIYDPNKTRFKTVCEGSAPVSVLLAANTFEQGAGLAVPAIEGGANVGRHVLANWSQGATVAASRVVPDVTDGNTLNLAGLALKDLRELSRMDLLLNYHINSATFPVPTSGQIATPPQLPVLNWTKRSDWLDVKNLPASVNGGVSAVGNGNPANKAVDTAAILAACNEVRKVNSQWSTVYLPPGTYCLAEELFPYPTPITVQASFTGSITGDTLTVTAVASGTIAKGHAIHGNGLVEGPLIKNGPSAGGVGTYKLTVAVPSPVSSRAMQSGPGLYTYWNMRGHGRDTIIEWHGSNGGRMFRSDGTPYSTVIGITWDGRGIAAQGFMHRSTVMRESKFMHQFELFRNFTQNGSGSASRPTALSAMFLESSSFRDCIFINCGTGLSATNYNDYMINVDGCHFYDNAVGVFTGNGQALIRNCRFYRSSTADVVEPNDSRANSIRRCSSVGSRLLYERNSTISTPTSRITSIQDVYVSGWTNTSHAILSPAVGANCYDPLIIFDCVFVNGPSANPPIKLDRMVQVLHSNNSWTHAGVTNTGAALFAGFTDNLQAIPVVT
jgi:hypothetical protein